MQLGPRQHRSGRKSQQRQHVHDRNAREIVGDGVEAEARRTAQRPEDDLVETLAHAHDGGLPHLEHAEAQEPLELASAQAGGDAILANAVFDGQGRANDRNRDHARHQRPHPAVPQRQYQSNRSACQEGARLDQARAPEIQVALQ